MKKYILLLSFKMNVWLLRFLSENYETEIWNSTTNCHLSKDTGHIQGIILWISSAGIIRILLHLNHPKLYEAVLIKFILAGMGQYLKWCQTPKLLYIDEILSCEIHYACIELVEDEDKSFKKHLLMKFWTHLITASIDYHFYHLILFIMVNNAVTYKEINYNYLQDYMLFFLAIMIWL